MKGTGWLVVVMLLAWHDGRAVEPPEGEAVQFFSDARITRFMLGGEDVLKEGRERNGFSVLVFDGKGVRTVPLTRVKKKNEEWLLQGKADFPRFTVRFQPAGEKVALTLVRLEGVPAGRDSSLVLTLGTRKPLGAAGEGILVEAGKDSLRIYWKFIGKTEAIKTFGTVEIGGKP